MTDTRYRDSLSELVLDITDFNLPAPNSANVQVCFSKSIQLPQTPIWYATTNNNDGTVSILIGPASPAIVTTLTAGCWFIVKQAVDSPEVPIIFGQTLFILS